MMATVLITDYPWPDLAIETGLITAAGHKVAAGPSIAGTATEIEALVRTHRPEAIMTCWATVSAEAVALPPDLKVVARMGVGLDNIAVEACTARGAWVTNVPDYCVEEVSDHAIGLLLAWTRGIAAFDRSVKGGAWDPASARLRRLSELTVGVVGYGRIARRTVAKLGPWGCRVLVQNRSPIRDAAVEQVDLTTLLGACDAVVIHVPLAPETHHLFDDMAFAAMKPGAFLINLSRGPVIDTAALERALDSGGLGGAGLDVIEGEPDPPRSLTGRDEVIVTPHVAFSSDASLDELRRKATQSVIAALGGESPPPNACNRV
jgi:D-3-phosphoglycerate dehydrogenase / 2-oxoglutarate reductase